MSQVLLGELIGGLPATGVRSLLERSHQPALASHIVDLAVHRAATVLHYDFPDAFPPHFRRRKALDDRIIATLRDVCVAPRSGLVWLPDARLLIEESVGSLRRIIGWGNVIHDALLPFTRLETGRPLIPMPFSGYYHWLLESLPAAILAKRHLPEAALLIHRDAPPVVEQAITQWLGPDAFAENVIIADGPLHVSELAFAALTPYSGFVNPEDLEVLRKVYGAGRGSRRIYVSRDRSPKRHLSNEADVERALVDEGLEIVYAEDLNFVQQRELFSDAALVVGPHGAGLANLVWSEAPGCVVEVFPYAQGNDCYARLAAALTLRYAYLMAHPTPNSAGLVGVPALVDLVRQMGFDLQRGD